MPLHAVPPPPPVGRPSCDVRRIDRQFISIDDDNSGEVSSTMPMYACHNMYTCICKEGSGGEGGDGEGGRDGLREGGRERNISPLQLLRRVMVHVMLLIRRFRACMSLTRLPVRASQLVW